MVVQTLVKPGEYRDSVALMLLARELALPGVRAVSVVMGTPANRALLQQTGLLDARARAAGPNDLVIALAAQDQAAARAAMTRAQVLLAHKAAPVQAGSAARPRTLRGAVRATPGANLAVISVPGQYAAAQAWDALRAGLHVLLFSDHVALADEIALKEYARAHGLLLMGPGAGTAIINGVGLGFANAVPRGNIGIVAAAGTGLQQVSTLIAHAGAGVSQAIGVGGRDVSQAVGGMMLLEGLRALQADAETRVIVVVAKMPAASVTEKILAQVRASAKPTVLALMTNDELPMTNSKSAVRNSHFAIDLQEAATLAVALARGKSADAARRQLATQDRALAAQARRLQRRLSTRQRYVRGLYSGGTLCEEALRIWHAALGEVWSNAPLDARWKLPDSRRSKRHTALDLGEEEFTLGRPHPMVDYTLRVQRLRQEARAASVAAIVLDVVLGYGAHPDPASELAPAIVEAKRSAAQQSRALSVIVSVIGTENDPQGRTRQMKALHQAGAIVLSSSTAAAKLGSGIVARLQRCHSATL